MTTQKLKFSVMLCLAVSVWSGSLLAATPSSYYDNSFGTLKTEAQTHLDGVGRSSQTYAVGVAPPMTRIYHEGGPGLAWTGTVEMTAAQGESEYRELAIIPMVAGDTVTNITVSIGSMVCTSPSHTLDAGEAKAGPVGYVTTGTAPDDHAMPDVMLEGWTDFTAGADQLQAVFVQFDISEDTPAGIYQGQVTIAPNGLYAEVFDIQLTVLDIVLPYGGPIPAHLSSTKGEMMHDHRSVSAWWNPPLTDQNGDSVVDFYELANLSPADINNISDSLVAYFAVPGNNYAIIRTPGSYQGGNLVGGNNDTQQDYTPDEIDAMKNYWSEIADILIGLGQIDKAALYVWDEPSGGKVSRVQTCCEWVHDANSNLNTLVVDITANCRTLRQNGHINHHIIRTPAYDIVQDAPSAWAPGTEVGIYVSYSSGNPYPNFLSDNTLLDARVFGWQIAQRGLTRFLYWSTQRSYWDGLYEDNFPDTDCGSMTNKGDGTLVHTAPFGTGWHPSQRLRNFADGMEDYIYIKTLEELMDLSDPANPGVPDTTEWQDARTAGAAALALVDTVGGSTMNSPTTSTTTLLDARSDIADAIPTLQNLLATHAVPNSIPYMETFESYANGFEMSGTKGWLAATPGDAVVSTDAASVDALNNYTNSVSCGYPVGTADHAKVLEITGPVTDRFGLGDANQMVWADMMLEAGALDTVDASLLVDAHAAVYFADGHPMVYHYDIGGSSNRWTEIPEVDKSGWVRVTVGLDYQTDYFQVKVDGVLLTSSLAWTSNDGSGSPGGSWFALPDGSGPLNEVVFDGDGASMDDLVVTMVDPFSAVIESFEHFSGDVYRMVFDYPVGNQMVLSASYPLKSTDLVIDPWAYVQHSTNGVNGWQYADLNYSATEGSNKVIYLQSTEPTAFFGLGE